MKRTKNIALVAHDNRKKDLVEWVQWNYETLADHQLICAGTTGNRIEKVLREQLEREKPGSPEKLVTKLKSGPLGGDQQLGALITEDGVDREECKPAIKDYSDYLERQIS